MKNFKNVLFLLAIFSLWSAKSYSEDFKWVVPDVSIAPGGTATVEVQATGKEFATLEMTINLPEGISYVADSWKLGSRITKTTYDFTFDDANPKSIHVVGNDDDANVISGTSGTVFSFDIKADESLEIGTNLTLQITGSLWTDYNFTEGDETPDMDVTIKVEEAAAETEKITLTKEYNTYVPTKDLDFSGVEGIKAYYVTAVTSTEATLTEATTVAAGEGIIISGTPGDYEVPVAATEVAKSTTNKLATGTIAEGDYILYDGEFVPCSGGTLPDGKAYLPKSEISTSSAKALILGFGDATGINEAKAAQADGAIYSISGVRVAQPQKGVYIMNGRKVIVK